MINLLFSNLTTHILYIYIEIATKYKKKKWEKKNRTKPKIVLSHCLFLYNIYLFVVDGCSGQLTSFMLCISEKGSVTNYISV